MLYPGGERAEFRKNVCEMPVFRQQLIDSARQFRELAPDVLMFSDQWGHSMWPAEEDSHIVRSKGPACRSRVIAVTGFLASLLDFLSCHRRLSVVQPFANAGVFPGTPEASNPVVRGSCARYPGRYFEVAAV